MDSEGDQRLRDLRLLRREEEVGRGSSGSSLLRSRGAWPLRSTAPFVLIFYLYPADMIPIVSHQPWRLTGRVRTSPEDGGSGCRTLRREEEEDAGLEGVLSRSNSAALQFSSRPSCPG